MKKLLVLFFLLILEPAYADFISPQIAGMPLATSNLTFAVATTGSDSNPCTSGSPCLTVQHTVNVAAQYNYQGLYAPTINIANGTYAGTQAVLLPLVNSPVGGSIIGNTTTPTSVSLNDSGTNFALTVPGGALWTVNGVSFGGTYGGEYVLAGGTLVFLKQNWGGALAQYGLYVSPGGAAYATPLNTGAPTGSTFTISASTMGTFIFSRGLIVLDSSSLTINNAITMTTFIGLDAFTFFAFNAATITNGTNVTATNGLIMSNGAFFESNSATKVDGTLLTRANVPGGTVSIDGYSVFQPDASEPYSNVFAFSTTNLQLAIIGTVGTDPSFVLNDAAASGVAWAFYSKGGFFEMLNLNSGSFQVPFAAGNAAFNLAGIPLTWNSGTQAAPVGAASDTGLSRTAAGVLAVGNGTQGDASGIIKSAARIATGSVPTGTTGSCTASSFVGGATAGKFTAPLCAAGTIILSALPTAPNGYTCNAQDQTTVADLLQQSANTVTSVTFKATTALNDVVVFQCTAW